MASTLDERLRTIEQSLVDLANKYDELASDDEINAVRKQIFDAIKEAEQKVEEEEKQIQMYRNLLENRKKRTR